LWTYTTALLEPHVDVIERVATELFYARSLSGDEIDALLAQYLCRS
jgi:hypothetical protein